MTNGQSNDEHLYSASSQALIATNEMQLHSGVLYVNHCWWISGLALVQIKHSKNGATMRYARLEFQHTNLWHPLSCRCFLFLFHALAFICSIMNVCIYVRTRWRLRKEERESGQTDPIKSTTNSIKLNENCNESE